MEEKKLVPKLRFPGFTEPWEQRKLSDILVERNEQQVETSEYPLMSFVQGIGVTPKGERYDRSFLVLDQSKKYKRTELGDFIYSSNNLETGSIGINKTGKAVISPVYSIFYGVSIGDSEFIGIMSLLPGFIAKMIRFRKGVVYGQWRIHEKDFLDISVSIPSVDERTKITKLILSIEELITLHQRKLEHLKLKKKSLLQKLFPKEGEVYPEFRFPGFTDPWEQRKFKSLFQKNLERNDGQFPFNKTISISRMIYSESGNGANTESLDNYKVLRVGDIAFEGHENKDFKFGRFVMNDVGNGIMSPRFTVLRPLIDMELNFWKEYINYEPIMQKKLVYSTKKGTMMNELVIEDFLNQYVAVPSIQEQQKIGYLLKCMTDDITLHQEESFLHKYML